MKRFWNYYSVITALVASQLIACQAYHTTINFLRYGLYGDDWAELNQSIEINPYNALAYYNRGWIRSESGDRQGAISDFTQAINYNSNKTDIFPTLADVYSARAQQYRILGNKQKAISDYQKAAELYKQKGDMHLYRLILQDLRWVQQY